MTYPGGLKLDPKSVDPAAFSQHLELRSPAQNSSPGKLQKSRSILSSARARLISNPKARYGQPKGEPLAPDWCDQTSRIR